METSKLGCKYTVPLPFETVFYKQTVL